MKKNKRNNPANGTSYKQYHLRSRRKWRAGNIFHGLREAVNTDQYANRSDRSLMRMIRRGLSMKKEQAQKYSPEAYEYDDIPF